MALGDAGNNSANKVYDSTYYSRIRIKNKDKYAVGFTFYKGLLKVELSEEKDNYKFEPLTSITISPTKARLLKDLLVEFIKKMESGEHIDPNEAVGINSGVRETVSFIAFKVTGKRTDVPEHSFLIGKVSGTGAVESVVEFVFNVDYDFSLRWTNVNDMTFEKNIDQFMGIKTFVAVLDEFIMSSSGAIGASVWDTGRYETNRIIKTAYPIYEKLGIERKKSENNNNSGVTENYFSRQGTFSGMNPPQSSSSTSRSLDELGDLLS